MMAIGTLLALACVLIGLNIYIKDEERSFRSFVQMLSFFLVGFIIILLTLKSDELRIKLGFLIKDLNFTMTRFYLNLFNGLNISRFVGKVRDILFQLILLVALIVGYFADK